MFEIFDQVTGERLVRRSDDTKEILHVRLESYQKITNPLVSFYQKQNLHFPVNGAGSMDDIFASIVDKIKALK